MAVALLRKPAALDTNVLLHMAEQHAPSHNVVLRLLRMGLMPIAVQTVVQELGALACDDTDRKKQAMAIGALTHLRSWGIVPLELEPVGNGISEVVADVMANRGLLPPEERNDAFIFIESAVCHAAMLVTWDGHLLDADNAGMNEVLRQFDLPAVRITPPSTILGY